MSDAGSFKTNPESETIVSAELPNHLLAKLRITIPGYELLEKIAAGGQATVYRARELTSGMTVAIKVLHGGTSAGDWARDRLQREIVTLKALKHPNIVCVIESGCTPTGLDYLVMNYIAGRALNALWTDFKFAAQVAPEPQDRIRLFKRICDIVQAAHLKGITHRDLSPSNILITDNGEPHILDFGLASTAFNELLTPHGKQLSVTGQFLGKIQYASPEQAKGRSDDVDIRTDVYALGVILYQILTNGAFPYEVVGNLIDVLNNIIYSKPLPPSVVIAARQKSLVDRKPLRQMPPAVNEMIESIVLKALEKEPARRYLSAGELGDDIERYLAGRPMLAITDPARDRAKRTPIRRRKKSLYLGALLVALLLILVASPLHLIKAKRDSRQIRSTPMKSDLKPTPTIVATPVSRAPFIKRGDWRIQDNELTRLDEGNAAIIFGDPNWQDFDLSVQIMRESGSNEISVIFRHMGTAMGYHCSLSNRLVGTDRDSFIAWNENEYSVLKDVDTTFQNDKWFTLSIHARGSHFRCTLQGPGKEIETIEVTDDRYPRGQIGFRTLDAVAHIRALTVKSPDGRLLWEGFPDLPVIQTTPAEHRTAATQP